MFRAIRFWIFACVALAGCASDEGGATVKKKCVPGQSVACPCPGGVSEGAQICNSDGVSYGACNGCPGSGTGGGGSGGTSGSAGWPGNGGAGATTSGGTTGGGGAPTGGGGSVAYTAADCLSEANNGSEVCDDSAWDVPSPGKTFVLVCINGNGGTIYVSKNTGPVMSDGIPRCQGWELNGQNAWDNLDYIEKLVCDSEQKTLDVDLSAYTGQTVFVGTHDAPTGGGHNTTTCIAWKK